MLRNFQEIYQYRSLIMALVGRHLAMRYRGSLLGFLWTLLNPLCLMLVYTLVFRYYIRFDQVENYTIFLFCGLLPWLWLSSGLLEATNSIVSSGHLITKSMFPAHILPVVAVITAMVNFVLSLPLLFIFMWFAGVPFHATLLLLPLIILAQAVIIFGLSLALGALNVHFRDVQHVVGNLLTFLFFLCPILYPITVVPEELTFTMEWNPLAVLTTMYQQVILHGEVPGFAAVGFIGLTGVVALIIGSLVFDHFRETFAELL